MKRRSIASSFAIIFSFLITACSAESVNAPTDKLVGSDRVSHDCIASAGYQFSVIQSRCIRIWEDGTELIHQGSGDSAFSAYALINGDQAEIFLPDYEGSVVLFVELLPDESASQLFRGRHEDTDYILTYDDTDTMVIMDGEGFVLYRYDASPSSASDEFGG